MEDLPDYHVLLILLHNTNNINGSYKSFVLA